MGQKPDRGLRAWHSGWLVLWLRPGAQVVRSVTDPASALVWGSQGGDTETRQFMALKKDSGI